MSTNEVIDTHINREGFYDDGYMRECTKCGEMFEKTLQTMSFCKPCNSSRVKSLSPEWKMWNRAKVRAKAKGIDFCIELADITIPTECPILGIELFVTTGKSGAFPNSPSLDRIDNNEGYIKGNVQVISQQANAMKGAASVDELLTFANYILEVYSEDN